MRFQFLSGDVDFSAYGGKWISNKQNNSEIDYWFVIELCNIKEIDNKSKYGVTLSVISPEMAENEIESALNSWGLESIPDNLTQSHKEMFLCDLLHSYGVFAPISTEYGNNWRKLLKETKKEAKLVEILFGFYMDKSVNAIGSNGWDFLKGDILAGIYKE